MIWSDEMLVVLLYCRGGYCIWRTLDEAVTKSCIRERWKGSLEFMFWGCFSYDQKGPFHYWALETAAEKKAVEEAIIKINTELKLKL